MTGEVISSKSPSYVQPPSTLSRAIYTLMTAAISEFMSVPVFDPSTIFMSKQEAVASIAEKNVADKKPYKVVRSSNDRYMVTCKTDECCYKVNIRKRADGLFHGSSYHEHTCTNIFAKLTTNWVRSKAKALIVNNATIKPKELQDSLRLEYVCT